MENNEFKNAKEFEESKKQDYKRIDYTLPCFVDSFVEDVSKKGFFGRILSWFRSKFRDKKCAWECIWDRKKPMMVVTRQGKEVSGEKFEKGRQKDLEKNPLDYKMPDFVNDLIKED